MGRPLAFHYHVKLGPRDEGYPILEQQCAPAPGDTGYTLHVPLHDQRRASDGGDRPTRSRCSASR